MAATLREQIDVAQQIVDELAKRERPEYRGKLVTNVVQVDTLSVDLHLDGAYAGTEHGLFASYIIHGRTPDLSNQPTVSLEGM